MLQEPELNRQNEFGNPSAHTKDVRGVPNTGVFRTQRARHRDVLSVYALCVLHTSVIVLHPHCCGARLGVKDASRHQVKNGFNSSPFRCMYILIYFTWFFCKVEENDVGMLLRAGHVRTPFLTYSKNQQPGRPHEDPLLISSNNASKFKLSQHIHSISTYSFDLPISYE